ncbi:MAG: hypothetical protein K2X98_03465, partial [Alphaproteobacteria bacterium]|nr:hypothetical protein [Alphaproteobacteria bacterium]
YNHKLQEEKERLHKGIMQVLFPSIAHPHNNTTHVTYHGYAPVNLYSIPQPTVQIPIIPHKNQ